ncbi:MAG: hypothetical protein QOF89_1925 [Acidobacteriota bacterium]|jgi:hypothetical protein|nr:hypothetical protein [Acidobacteriota bacterium]
MSSSFVVYIDESGDEGFAFGKGSSEWFVLSAVVTLQSEDMETVRLVDRVRSRLKRPDHKPLHFRDLRHEHRLAFVAEIAVASLRVVTLLVHKPSLLKYGELLGRDLYFSGVTDLLERIALLCKVARPRTGDGTAEILFSHRSGMSYGDLRDFLQGRVERKELDGTFFRQDRVQSLTSGRRKGLQIADAVASGFFKAVEPTEYGFTEDRYARILKPILFRSGSLYLGFGLQLWPNRLGELMEEHGPTWVQEAFGGEEE